MVVAGGAAATGGIRPDGAHRGRLCQAATLNDYIARVVSGSNRRRPSHRQDALVCHLHACRCGLRGTGCRVGCGQREKPYLAGSIHRKPVGWYRVSLPARVTRPASVRRQVLGAGLTNAASESIVLSNAAAIWCCLLCAGDVTAMITQGGVERLHQSIRNLATYTTKSGMMLQTSHLGQVRDVAADKSLWTSQGVAADKALLKSRSCRLVGAADKPRLGIHHALPGPSLGCRGGRCQCQTRSFQ